MANLAEDKRRAREEQLRRSRTKGRLRLAAIAAGVVALVAAIVWIYTSDLFAVTDVRVLGATRLSEKQVITLAAIPKGVTLLRLPSADIVKRVRSDPWVADAQVSRDFPHAVTITVQERKPFAAVEVGRLAYLVDKTGVVLAAQPTTTTALPLMRDIVLASRPLPSQRLTSLEFNNALMVLEALPRTLRDQISFVYAKTVDDLKLGTKTGLEIMWGRAEQMDTKRYAVERLIAGNPKKIIYIDVRVPGTPTAKYAP